jgi:hypothetical protein
MRQSRRRLAILASVVLLAGFSSRCELIESDVRLLTDDTTLVDLPELQGSFVDEARTGFEITRLGPGSYQYQGPTLWVPDPELVPAVRLVELEATLQQLAQRTSDAFDTASDEFIKGLEIVLAKPEFAVFFFPDRRCERLLAELFDRYVPGTLAFERWIASLPKVPTRHRMVFSLHNLGNGRLVVQAEDILEQRSHQKPSLQPVLNNLHKFILSGIAYILDHDFFDYENKMRPFAVHFLIKLDENTYALPTPAEACKESDHLAAYGFKLRTDQQGIFRAIVDATGADVLGMLKACFPEDLTDARRFWKVGAVPASLPTAEDE